MSWCTSDVRWNSSLCYYFFCTSYWPGYIFPVSVVPVIVHLYCFFVCGSWTMIGTILIPTKRIMNYIKTHSLDDTLYLKVLILGTNNRKIMCLIILFSIFFKHVSSENTIITVQMFELYRNKYPQTFLKIHIEFDGFSSSQGWFITKVDGFWCRITKNITTMEYILRTLTSIYSW